MIREIELTSMVDDYDWQEVFKTEYATPEAIPGVVCDTSLFTLQDVERIIGSVNGENDGPSWVAVGQLNDGRYFAIRAGCDYTGWG